MCTKTGILIELANRSHQQIKFTEIDLRSSRYTSIDHDDELHAKRFDNNKEKHSKNIPIARR